MTEPDEDMILRAMVKYLDSSLSTETLLRELLAKTGHNDPEHSVEECLRNLVVDYLRITTR